jgi:kynurenine formamidase
MEACAMEQFKAVDLTHKVHPEIPTWDLTCGYYIKTMRDYKHCPGEFKFRSQALDIRASAGTHIDSPAHCFEGARDVSGLILEELICPCVVVDVSQKAHERYKVSKEDIENFETRYGKIPQGSFVLFYTGWSRFWDEPSRYHNNLVFPSVSAEVAHMLLERQIAGIGIDTLSPDCDEKGSFVHSILLGANKYIVENVAHAHNMPAIGAYILVMPLYVEGAAESPVRLIGLIE